MPGSFLPHNHLLREPLPSPPGHRGANRLEEVVRSGSWDLGIRREIADRKVLRNLRHKKQGIVTQSPELHGKVSSPTWDNVCSHPKG